MDGRGVKSPAGDRKPFTESFNQSAGSSSALATTAAAFRTSAEGSKIASTSLVEVRALNASSMAVPPTILSSPIIPRRPNSSESWVKAVMIVSRDSMYLGYPIDSALFTATCASE